MVHYCETTRKHFHPSTEQLALTSVSLPRCSIYFVIVCLETGLLARLNPSNSRPLTVRFLRDDSDRGRVRPEAGDRGEVEAGSNGAGGEGSAINKVLIIIFLHKQHNMASFKCFYRER